MTELISTLTDLQPQHLRSKGQPRNEESEKKGWLSAWSLKTYIERVPLILSTRTPEGFVIISLGKWQIDNSTDLEAMSFSEAHCHGTGGCCVVFLLALSRCKAAQGLCFVACCIFRSLKNGGFQYLSSISFDTLQLTFVRLLAVDFLSLQNPS